MTGTEHIAQKCGDYLVHSYLYYKMDTSIISDYDYDQLCYYLLERVDEIPVGMAKLITADNLRAGSGYSLDDYPRVIIKAAKIRLGIYQKQMAEADTVPYADRGVSTDPIQLEADLKGLPKSLLKGLLIDYHMFLYGEHRDMALGVVDKLLKRFT